MYYCGHSNYASLITLLVGEKLCCVMYVSNLGNLSVAGSEFRNNRNEEVHKREHGTSVTESGDFLGKSLQRRATNGFRKGYPKFGINFKDAYCSSSRCSEPQITHIQLSPFYPRHHAREETYQALHCSFVQPKVARGRGNKATVVYQCTSAHVMLQPAA